MLHVIVDGQFGSTGKGLLSHYVAITNRIDLAVSTASAQAGHTFVDGTGKKRVVYHLSAGGAAIGVPQFLSGACTIDLEVLKKEVDEFYDGDWSMVRVHPNATIITPEDSKEDAETTKKISGTGKGVGRAFAKKVLRNGYNIAKDNEFLNDMGAIIDWHDYIDVVNSKRDILLDIPQGLSLGINGPFYPYCTSRECTIMQGLADAQINYFNARGFRTYMSMRTFPIRVGSVEGGWSGPCYPDQEEISWEDLGVEPERTTVTNRVRRVFTFSYKQLEDAVKLNSPDVVFMNFMNYLKEEEIDVFVSKVLDVIRGSSSSGAGTELLLGYGPSVADIRRYSSLHGFTCDDVVVDVRENSDDEDCYWC